MIVHLVLFRPKPDLADVEKRGLVDALTTAMREIPSIRRVRAGTRVMTGRPYEQLMRTHYSHLAILEFDDESGLRAYLQHPAHDALASRFFAVFEEALMYDFALGDDPEKLVSVGS